MKGEKKGQGGFRETAHHISLTLRFVICIFIILVLTFAASCCLILLLHFAGILDYTRQGHGNYCFPLFVFGMISVVLGVFFSLVFSRRVLKPIREVIEAADELASGNFDIQIEIRGARETQELSRSFNHMAEELSSLELLRTDFVNNFSHEFKTPIASIRGFARILQREDLTEEERKEYLEIIADESERLTELATNVLNLSRIENQTILSSQTVFNCSEQIRRAIVLLEPKWSKKNQNIRLECDEVKIYANMELLEQVWINLLDNAIKFSPENSEIRLLIRKRPGYILVTVSDSGPGIEKEAEAHIFDKFYQGDTSHAVAGNGLGLAIVRKILELHEGSIRVAETGAYGTVFEVRLPVNLPMVQTDRV
ncbi:MAG: HAMP domain-containing sensor histidine kinase [Lachnospiraceae bacterium]|nr:HAMP domain-containing sensor histidine kinase [Lachnospiraceae bacterium]